MSVIKVGTNTYVGHDADKPALAKPTTIFFAFDVPRIYVYGNDNQPVSFNGDVADPPLQGYTSGTIPAGSLGDKAYVTDATTPTWGAAYVGGGAVVVPVFHNGTIWITV